MRWKRCSTALQSGEDPRPSWRSTAQNDDCFPDIGTTLGRVTRSPFVLIAHRS